MERKNMYQYTLWGAFVLLLASVVTSDCIVYRHHSRLSEGLARSNRIITLMRQQIFKNDASTIHFDGVSLHLPFYQEDYIQHAIYECHNFYDGSILEALDTRLPKDAVIVDIGSNIGNHCVYWAKKSGAKKIFAFEPIMANFEVLRKNIELNGAKQLIQAYNCAIGDSDGCVSVKYFNPQNRGLTQLEEDEQGTILVHRLDTMNLPTDRIDLIKISAENFEVKVLQGAQKTFQRHHPKLVWIEINQSNSASRRQARRILSAMGYRLIKYFKKGVYLYEYRP